MSGFDILTDPVMIVILRVFSSFVALTILAWGWKIIKHKRKTSFLKVEFQDWLLMLIALYWSAYNIWALAIYGDDPVILIVRLFSLRFGILLTLIAMAFLTKDKLLCTHMMDFTLDDWAQEEEEESCDELTRS